MIGKTVKGEVPKCCGFKRGPNICDLGEVYAHPNNVTLHLIAAEGVVYIENFSGRYPVDQPSADSAWISSIIHPC
jgi:hypothetical protein